MFIGFWIIIGYEIVNSYTSPRTIASYLFQNIHRLDDFWKIKKMIVLG